uniref:Uncharacterized protein n=1 Tax=Setaria italica TaxID=4555 RepID=K4A3K2_SETIT
MHSSGSSAQARSQPYATPQATPNRSAPKRHQQKYSHADPKAASDIPIPAKTILPERKRLFSRNPILLPKFLIF